MILPNFGRIAKLVCWLKLKVTFDDRILVWSISSYWFTCVLQPLPLKHLTEGLSGRKSSDDNEIYKLFTNVMNLLAPKVCLLSFINFLI